MPARQDSDWRDSLPTPKAERWKYSNLPAALRDFDPAIESNNLLRVNGGKAARYDLPLHFNGHIMDVGFKSQSAVANRPVLGKANAVLRRTSERAVA